MSKKPSLCYCDSGQNFANCCQPLVSGSKEANCAEALMRSRYTAFCLHEKDYLVKTWHKSTCPSDLDFDERQKWLGLKIVSTRHGQMGDDKGQVEFVARYRLHGKAYRLHELSDFVFENGLWRYTKGVIFE